MSGLEEHELVIGPWLRGTVEGLKEGVSWPVMCASSFFSSVGFRISSSVSCVEHLSKPCQIAAIGLGVHTYPETFPVGRVIEPEDFFL